MNITEIKNKILSGGFDNDFAMLYGDTAAARERYLAAVDEFAALYGERDNIRLFSAPGRTEIGGNHTDHQHGMVLAGSVDLDVLAVVSVNNSDIVRIKSQGYPMDEIDVTDLGIKEQEIGRAASLIRGVCAAFSNNGFALGGFDAYTTSNVLKGSGLSSSAAFEVLVANVINGLFCDNAVDAISIAKYSQFAEREYFGKPCGLLDQMASSVGGFTFADFLNPADPEVHKVDCELAKSGHTLCVVDTGGNHANLTGDYADITTECREISEFLGVEFLRDADVDKFYDSILEMREKCSHRAILRAFHFINENQRVADQYDALKNNDFDKFFSLVNQSGDSSYNYLQNLYSISNPAEQNLCVALALSKKFLGDKGACRVHGGGFAGTIQCYIPNDMLAQYKQMIEKAFGQGSCVVLAIRPVGGYEIK